MKFQNNDILFHVCPATCVIEQVQIEYAIKEDNGFIYWIDYDGGYLAEQDLFLTLKEAKKHAITHLKDSLKEGIELLNESYKIILADIIRCDPKLKIYKQEFDILPDEDEIEEDED